MISNNPGTLVFIRLGTTLFVCVFHRESLFNLFLQMQFFGLFN